MQIDGEIIIAMVFLAIFIGFVVLIFKDMDEPFLDIWEDEVEDE